MTLSEYFEAGHGTRKAVQIDAGLTQPALSNVINGTRPVSLRAALMIEIATGGAVSAELFLKDERDFKALAYLRGGNGKE